jgi:hypothetical protein
LKYTFLKPQNGTILCVFEISGFITLFTAAFYLPLQREARKQSKSSHPISLIHLILRPHLPLSSKWSFYSVPVINISTPNACCMISPAHHLLCLHLDFSSDLSRPEFSRKNYLGIFSSSTLFPLTDSLLFIYLHIIALHGTYQLPDSSLFVSFTSLLLQ